MVMQSLDIPQLWQDVLTDLQKGFQGAGVVAMLKYVRLNSVSPEEIILSVDNLQVRTFVRKYLEQEIVRRITQEVSYTPQTVTYLVEKREAITVKTQQAMTQERDSIFAGPSESLEANPRLAANLNPKFTFEKFIVGTKNRLAYAAAEGVSDQPGTLYNPLYIYGGVGLGKTHLLQAIGNKILDNNPQAKVIYVSCESFMNEFAMALNQKRPDSFKQKYRNVDVFLIDDIQFVAGRDGLQEEFFHTFNSLHQADKQIVMTSDKMPSEIKGLEDRLSSRFSMGMVADMQLPDQMTRQAILMAKCAEKRISISNDALAYIAEHVETNIRELEGALTTVLADIYARDAQPSLPEIRTSLRKLLGNNPSQQQLKHTSSSLLMEIICQTYSITKEELLSSKRTKELVHPRHLAMYLLKHEAGLTYPSIGKELGGRDHTTIMHGVEKVTKDLKKDAELLTELQAIKERFYEYR
jgi:chromosomal replication initiator protein